MRKNAFANVAVQETPRGTDLPTELQGVERETPPSYPKHRQGKKAIISYHAVELSDILRTLAIKRRTTLQALAEEAYRDLLKKYGESSGT